MDGRARTSIVHLLIFAVPQIFIGRYLLRLSPLETGVALSVGIFINLWIHTNIRLNLGPFAKVFVTPNYHRFDHGGGGQANKNLGFIFTAWDRLFGTYLDLEIAGKDFPIVPVPTGKQLLRMMLGL